MNKMLFNEWKISWIQGAVMFLSRVPYPWRSSSFTNIKFSRSFPQRKSVTYFLYGPYWANIDKIKFTVAQRRLAFEVTFQLLDVTNTWSCDSHAHSWNVSWKILCYMSKWEGDNVLLEVFHCYFFFLISSVCLDFKRLTHKKYVFPSQNRTVSSKLPHLVQTESWSMHVLSPSPRLFQIQGSDSDSSFYED